MDTDHKVTTGIDELDDLTGGLKGGQLVMLAGRPGMGMSTFGMNLVGYVCGDNIRKTLVFSPEMSKEMYYTRLGNLYPGQIFAGLCVDDTPLVPVSHIEKRINEEKRISTVLVDYLQLVGKEPVGEKTLFGLKELAKRYEIPVVVLSNINHCCENRKDHSPLLSDFYHKPGFTRSALEFVDVIMFLHREYYYQGGKRYYPKKLVMDAGEQEAEIILAKHPQLEDVPKTIRVFYDHRKGGFYNGKCVDA